MGSKCCKCGSSKTISGQRSVSTYATYPKKRSRTRRRMVGDDGELDDIVEDERFSEPQWSASGHPVLARRLSDLSVKVGARARFLVEVSSPTPVSVRWEKDGRTVDESDRINTVAEGNFHCLDISPVNQEDAGLWRVKVTNMVGTAMSSAQLTLLVPKAYKTPEFVEPLRAVLTAQGTVSLECKVIGVPTPLLRWFKGSNEIKAGDVLALTPNAADPTSLGTYTCLAANCMGTAESTSIVHIDGTPATVQGFLPTGPKPIFAKELRNEKVKLGGSITLECKVTVPPWPEAVNWYGPKGEVLESNRTHLIEDGAGLYSLKISTVTAEDSGTWKCVATNKHGAKAMSTSLISVNYPKNYRKPKFLESLKAVLTEEGLVSFECKVVGYPTPNLSWFKDGQELKPGDVYQLTGTNSLGSYCCIARNCMGEAQSSAELTLEDIKSQLSEEEKVQLSSEKLPPRFVAGLKSVEAKINESLRLSIKVSVFPEPVVMWFRDDEVIEDSDKYKIEKDKLGAYHMNINKLEFCDQAEWKCVATNDYGQSVTSSFVKLNIPKHFKKPKFLEDLKAVMSEEGAVNLECKVIGVPQPKLKWFKDGKELKPGDIHKIISGQDGTCCLGTYTCLAQNCMGSVSSSASLLGFEEKGEKSTGAIPDASRNGQVLSRDRSLSTIHEERTSQLHDTDKSTTIDDRAEEVSFSFDGKEVSVSLYETPDLTEEEALQIVEMYADQISEHVTEQNVVELPPMRFTKESSTSGKLLMEAVVIDVNPEYFSSTPAPRKVVEDDLRTDADVDEFSLVEELNTANLSPDRHLSPIENLTMDQIAADFVERTPSKPPRSKTKTSAEIDKSLAKDDIKGSDDKMPQPKKRGKKKSTDSEKEDDSLQEFERRKTQDSQKQSSERKRTDSEIEDDSLYEFESRKTKDDVFKSCKEDEPYRYSTETGVARTPENESQFYSPMKSPHSVASKMTEDEATFNTAEDSAFDKSEMSVLETLAHSLHEIQKNLTAVEAHVASDSSTGDMQSAQGISEYLAEPLAEVQKSLEIVEAQIQEFPSGKYSSDVLETLIQPITKFKKNLALLEERSLPSILESVAGPLEELNREITYIQQATQSQIEYAKSVEQVQESLTKIIERQASVPSDRKLMDTISTELEKLEEKANDDLETYYDRLLTVGSELRSKANLEQDQEIQDILKAVGDLVKPLKRLTAVTSKSIAVIVEDNKMGNIPTKKIVESLLKPLDALDASLSLLESVGMLKSHKAIRGAGIPILYKVSVPMEELETTIKLVENLSAHSAVEFLIPPLDNLVKVVSDIDVSTGGDGFLEDLQGEGTPIVKNLDDSLDIMLNCINSVDKGVTVVESERGIPGKLPALLKPMEDLQKSLKAVEKGIVTKDVGYEDVYMIAQELSKPLQSIRSEFSILQHEIEADHYSSEPNPSQTALTTLVEPLESVQNCISSFHETIMCKSADDPMHLRFVLYALKELAEPLSSLSGKMIKAEEILLGKGDPFQGLKAVARSVSELRESSSAITTESNVIEQMSSILSEPLNRVQKGLETILQFVDKKDKQDLNKDLLKRMDEPFKELQCALLKIEGNIHENVTEGVTPELRQAVQELQRSILIIQDQSSFEYGDEPSTIEANIETLQSLTQPLQTLHAQFTEVQRFSNRTLMRAERALITLKDSTRRVSSTIIELKSKRSGTPTGVGNILQVLGNTVEELETAVEDANLHLGRGKRVDGTRRILANTLKVASSKLGEVCSRADDMSVSVEPNKRKSLVLVQDFIHNLKVAIEQSTRVIDSDKGTAIDRSRDTLIAIEQLASAMSQFHDQLKSVEEFSASTSSPQGMNAIKEQVDKLQTNVAKALTSNIPDKNDKMILETIENDVKSVQRVLDNLISEDAADGARVRFILAKAESIHSDLKDMVQSADSPSTLKTACQAALAVLDIGEGLMNRKSPLRMEILSQVEHEPEVSVIGELLETLDELDRCFNKLKREAKIKVADKEVAEMAMEIATLQALVQDVATEASGELLDKVVEVCIPIKAIEVKLAQTTNLTPSDLEETSESLHNINQVLNSAIRKKEAEKLMQPSTSIIGELLETVGDLETSFDRMKRSPLPNDATESEVNDVGREILALQNIVDDLTSEATGELLDKAQEICIPIKSIESSLKHYAVLTKTSICEVKDKLKTINDKLKDAIAQNEIDKQKREKEFEKLFSSESLSSSVDVPIVRSIVTTIEYMQAHLNSLIVPPDMAEVKNFLERFECSLVRYGECLTHGWNANELQEHVSDLEAALKTADITRVEMRKLVKAVEGLKSSRGEMSKALSALQSVLSPLKTLHEELSRPNSPKRIKKAELKYLESFSKSSTDLELGLMKMEKAIVTGTKLEVDSMATPVEQLASFIDGIAHEPSLKNLDEDSSIAALKSLAQPINTIKTIVAQVQEAVVKHDDKKAAELLTAIAKPVRELRTNIALIQDQAMMNCSLSQLDELKQAVALMTQVGTETPGLKQPLLQLQARLQELEPEAELAEVVSELTGPVDALKQAVTVLETKGESSMLLELCHQVVEIINRGDDTLSEMSSLCPLSTKADPLPADALLKAATLCHELMEDQSLSELSHTDDTLTPTHAAEQLPSIHGAATAEQHVLFEQIETLMSSPLSLQEAAARSGSVAGNLKAGLIEHELVEDQTISEISEMDNSMSAAMAVEKLPSIRGTLAGEQKMVLEEAESFGKSLKSTTEALAKLVPQEHMQIATTELNVLEDQSLSDLSPNELSDSATLPLEKLTSIRGTVAAEEKLVFEHAQSLENSLLSVKEAKLGEGSIAGQLNAASAGLIALEEQSLSELSVTDQGLRLAVGLPKLTDMKEAAVAEHQTAMEEIGIMSDRSLSKTEVSVKDVSERLSAKANSTEILQGPSQLSVVEVLLMNDITTLGCLKSILSAITQVPQIPRPLNEKLVSLNVTLENVDSNCELRTVLDEISSPISDIEVATSKCEKESGRNRLLDACSKTVTLVKKQQKIVLDEVNTGLKDAARLLTDDKQDIPKLKKTLEALLLLPSLKMLHIDDVQKHLLALHSELDQLSPLAKPDDILRQTMTPIKELKQVIMKLEKENDINVLDVCRKIVNQVELGKDILQKEAAELLKEDTQDVTKFKKAVAILVNIPNEGEVTCTALEKPFTALNAVLEQMGPLTKPEEILRLTVEPLNSIRMCVEDLEKTEERPKILEVAQLILKKSEKCKQVVQEQVIHSLKGGIQDPSALKKAVSTMVTFANVKDQKSELVSSHLVALQAKLEQLSPGAKPEDILKGTIEPVSTLKAAITDLKKSGESSLLLDMCELLIQKTELAKETMLQDVVKLLKGETQNVKILKKAVATLIEIPIEKAQKLNTITQPLVLLQAKLGTLGPKAEPMDVLRVSVEPVNALKQVVSDLKKSGEKSQLLDMCDLVIASTEHGKEEMQKQVVQLLKSSKLQKAVAILVDIPTDRNLKVIKTSEPLKALQGKLDKLGTSAKPEEIVRGTLEPLSVLKQVVSEVKSTGEKSELLDICELVIEKVEEGKIAMQQEAMEILKADTQSVSTLKKAITTLVDIPKDEGKTAQITQPLSALHAKLEMLNPTAEPIEVFRGTLAPVAKLKQVLTDLKKSGETSLLLEICELVIKSTEKGKAAMHSEATKLLTTEIQSVANLQKAVAILVDIPKGTEQKISKVDVPLKALQGKLETLGPSAKPEDILRCTMEPIKALKQIVAEVSLVGEKSELSEICRMVVSRAEEGKENMGKEVEKLLKEGKADVATLKKAVATLVEIPKDESQKIVSLTQPLVTLQSTLNCMNPRAEPIDILRGTLEPVNELKEVVSGLKLTGEKSQLLEICEMVIQKAEHGKEAMQTEAVQLLKGELKDTEKLKKAVALLIDIPKDRENLKMSIVNEPLIALQATLGSLGTSAISEDIIKCTVEPIKTLKVVVSEVKRAGESSQLLDICQSIIDKVEEGKGALQKEVFELLKSEIVNISILKKAVTTLVNIPQEGGQRAVEMVTKPLVELKTKLDKMNPKTGPIDIVRGTIEPVKVLKQVVRELKTSGECSQLLEICELVILKTEKGKAAMLAQVVKLLRGEMDDPTKLKEAISMLVSIPKDEEQKISSIDGPLVALQNKLQYISPSSGPQDVVLCSVEPVIALRKVLSDVKQAGEKSELLETSELILEKIEQCKDAMQKEAEGLLAENSCDVTKLKKAVGIVINIPKYVEEGIVKVNEPLTVLKAKLDALPSESKPEDIVRGTSNPIQELKAVVSILKKDSKKSKLLDVCGAIIVKAEQGKELMQKDAAQLISGELKDVTKLKKAVALLVDIPKEKEDRINDVNAPLIALQARLDKLPTNAKPGEIQRETAEDIKVLEQVVTKLDALGQKSSLVEVCHGVVKHVQSGKEKEKKLEDIGVMIQRGVRTIKQLSEVTEILTVVNVNCEPLKQPVNSLESKLSFLHQSSNIEDFVPDLVESVKMLKKTASSLEKVSVQNDLLKNVLAVIDHLEPIFHIDQLEQAELRKKEEQAKKEKEEKEKKEKIEQEKKEKDEKTKQEKERKEEEEKKAKLDQEKKELEENKKKAKLEKENKEKEEKAKLEQERKEKEEKEKKAKIEQEKKEQEEKEKKAKIEMEKKEKEEKAKLEQEGKEKEEKEKKTKLEQEKKEKEEKEKKAKLEKENKEKEEKAKLEQERKEKEEKEKKAKLEQEKKEQEEKEKKAKIEKEKEEKAKLEQKRKEKEEKEKKAKLEQDKKEKEEKEKKAKIEKESKEKEEKAKLEQDRKEREEKEKKAKLEKEKKEQDEKEKKVKIEKENKEKEEKAKLEQERKEKEEKEKKAKLEQENKEQEEKEKKAKIEKEKKEKEGKAKLEQERNEKEEKEKKAKLEQEKKEQEEKEKKAKIEKEKEEKAKLEQERNEKEEKEKKAKLEQEKKEQEEKEKKAKIEKENKEKEEKAKLEQERNEKEEKEKKAKLEQEKKEQEEKEKKAKIEKENKEKEEKAKLEQERKENEEKEKKAKLEQEKKDKEEKAKVEQKRKEKEKEEKKVKLEKENKEKEEKEIKAKIEKDKKEKEEEAKLEQERRGKEENEKTAKLEQVKKEIEEKAKIEREKEEEAKLEQERREKEQIEKKAKLEQEKKEQEEKEKKAKIEKEKKEKEEKANLEQERKEKEEKEKKAKLEQENEAKMEQEKKDKEKLEQVQKEVEEKKAKIEQENKEKEEKEKNAKIEQKRKEKEEREKNMKTGQEKKEKEQKLEQEKEKNENEEEEKKAKLEQEKEGKSKLEQKRRAKEEMEKEAKKLRDEQATKAKQEEDNLKNEKKTVVKEQEETKAKQLKDEKELKAKEEDDENKSKLEAEKNKKEEDNLSKLDQEKKKKEQQRDDSKESKDATKKAEGEQIIKDSNTKKDGSSEIKVKADKEYAENGELAQKEKEGKLEETLWIKSIEDKEKAETDRKAREKQQSLSYVDDLISCKGIKTIAQFKQVVEIMRLYKHVFPTLSEPLDGLSASLESLYEKSEISDFVLDLIQPMLKLKRASDSAGGSSEKSGLLIICLKLINHLEPVLHLCEVDRKEKQREEVQKFKKQKEEQEVQAKAAHSKAEELEKERIDTEMRQAKAKAEEEKKQEELKKKQQKDDKKTKENKEIEKNRTDSIKQGESVEDGKRRQEERKTHKDKEIGDRKEPVKQGESLVEDKASHSVEIETKIQDKDAGIPEQNQKDKVVGQNLMDRGSKKTKAKVEAENRAKELQDARNKEKLEREEKALRMQQEREKLEEKERSRREKEKVDRETRATEDNKKLEKEKEEVEQRERTIKAKLEQVKREKRELEMEEEAKMMQARKQEKQRQEQEEIVRKEKEETRIRVQQEREQEMKKQRLKELERREAELDSIRSRESLRMSHLDDVVKREVAKGISKSLDAVYLSSAEKLYKGPMAYSASVSTMNARDAGVHSARGISVVELMDYQPPPVRPERTKKYDHRKVVTEREFDRPAVSKWDSRLRDLSPDTRRRPKDLTTYTPQYDSNQDISARTWDRSKEQSWKHLEYPTPEYEAPAAYHRSRRSMSPLKDFGSTQSVGGTRYQAAPVPVQPYHRSRRSLSPLERSLNQPYTGSTVSLTSMGSRKHIDELTSARIRPPTPTRSYVPTRSSSISKPHQRAYIVNGLVDKTVIHGGKIRLSCNIGGDPNPSIEWMKDGKSIAYHTEASRYKTECNYGVACLEVDGARLSDAGQYTCVVKNVDGQTATTCTVRVALNDDDDKEWESIENELEANMPREVCLSIKGSAFGMPRVTGLVADPLVPCGGTIAVHVQVAGCHRPEVTWLHGGAPLPKYSPRVHYFEDGGLFTLLLEGATPSESGVYTCRVSGRGRGAVDTATTVQVVEKRGHEKPAIFNAKPDTRMTLTAGDDMTLTCYVGGEPRPQVILTKGIKDITSSCRTLKEIFGEYVRLTLKRVTLEDRGTFFIVAKNIYGTDRTFVTLDVREQAKSLTPPSWSERTASLTSLYKEVHHSSTSWRSAANLHTSYSSLHE